MTIFIDVIKELFAMFVTDARLTVAVLILVAIVAWLIAVGVNPILCGGLLLLGSVLMVMEATAREAGRKR